MLPIDITFSLGLHAPAWLVLLVIGVMPVTARGLLYFRRRRRTPLQGSATEISHQLYAQETPRYIKDRHTVRNS